MKIEELLRQSITKLENAGIEEAKLKAKLIIAYVIGQRKEFIISHMNQEIDESLSIEIYNKIDELKNGIPLEYITNNKEFMKLNFYVNENVLIPRQDTEILVEEIIKTCRHGKVLDLCTGSGAIAVSLAKYLPDCEVFASDISTKAIEIAKTNARNNGVNVSFIESNMFENIIDNDFDVIVSNPPYIESRVIKTLQEEVQHEPHIALDGGEDGLDFYRIIANEAKLYLKKGGLLALEIGYNQAENVAKLLKDYNSVEIIKDLAKNDRVIIAS